MPSVQIRNRVPPTPISQAPATSADLALLPSSPRRMVLAANSLKQKSHDFIGKLSLSPRIVLRQPFRKPLKCPCTELRDRIEVAATTAAVDLSLLAERLEATLQRARACGDFVACGRRQCLHTDQLDQRREPGGMRLNIKIEPNRAALKSRSTHRRGIRKPLI